MRTPILMQGYYKDPEQTAAAMHDGWFATGDLVRRDADGYYYFVARKKDIIRHAVDLGAGDVRGRNPARGGAQEIGRAHV